MATGQYRSVKIIKLSFCRSIFNTLMWVLIKQ